MLKRFGTIILCLVMPSTLLAVYEKGNGDEFPWGMKTKGYHDAAVAEKLGKGFFMNVGPTGVRARITHEHPKYFTVKFVFEKSPAAGRIEAGDIIIGANGKVMDVDHRFGRRGDLGWDGPMVEMSKLIEDSQGKDGKLELIVWPQGKKENQKIVILQIETVGRFAKTYPYDCERSNKLMEKLCDFLAAEYKRENGFAGRPHTSTASILALMANGDKKYSTIIKEGMQKYYAKRYSSENSGGFPAWGFGHDGVVMGEYYYLTKDKKLLPAIESLSLCMEESQTYKNGGYSHKPGATIVRRFLSGGPKGYGSMAMPSAIIMTALSIFKQAGIGYSVKAHERLHQAFLSSMTSAGAIDYGFKTWDHAVIVLKDGKKLEEGTKGIGFACPSGMKDFGEYKIEWPTKKDPRYRDTAWLEKERATNKVFDFGEGKRLVVRLMLEKEPTKAYSKPGKSVGHYGRSGAGALGHLIGNEEKSWKFTGDLLASACANSARRILDGHASTLMHPMWGSLGAAMADPKEFRKYMDGIKWWMIMAQSHDNGFVVMPGRDYASTDHVYGTRKFPSGIAALALSVKDRNLLITGSGLGKPVPKSKRSSTAVTKKSFVLKKISAAEQVKLNEILLASLADLSQSDGLRMMTVPISKTKAKIWLCKAASSGALTFQLLKGEKQATFKFDDLSMKDHVMLARLIAALKPESKQAQAVASLYVHSIGQRSLSLAYLKKSSPDHLENIMALLLE